MSSRGSLWRVWDLHIHTPASHTWNGQTFDTMSPQQEEEALSRILKRMEEVEVAAFAVMDYWTFDGYSKIQECLNRSDRGFSKVIFPGMELRLQAPMNRKLHGHLLLSDKTSSQTLQDLKSKLQIRIGGQTRPISLEAFAELGESQGDDVKRTHGFRPSEMGQDDFAKLGMIVAEISLDSVLDALSSLPEDQGLFVLPWDTYGGLGKLEWDKHPHSADSILQAADILEARKPKNRDLILGVRTEVNEGFIDEFQHALGGRPKPVVAGSDAHSVSEYGVFPEGRATWIKADPSFEGLAQVIVEPQQRSYVGEQPPAVTRVYNNPTKYIDAITICKRAESRTREKWFDQRIELNPQLVAVIGNKGTGKSALADIIALAAGSHSHGRFAFLNEDKFRKRPENKASSFEATLELGDGTTARRSLEEDAPPDEPELAQYLPQHRIEEICNEVESGTRNRFQSELQRVIFSHVVPSDRLGEQDLPALISRKTLEIDDAISLLRQKMSSLNVNIVKLEHETSSEYRARIEGAIKHKRKELRAHMSRKPDVVPEPETDSEAQRLLLEESETLDQYKQKRDSLEKHLTEGEKRRATLIERKADIQSLSEGLDNLQARINRFFEQYERHFDSLGLAADSVLSYKTNREPLVACELAIHEELHGIEQAAATVRKDLGELAKTVEVLKSKMDEPSRAYEVYLSTLADWRARKQQIEGGEDIPDTLKYYQQILGSWDLRVQELDVLSGQRKDLAFSICKLIGKKANIYRELYKPVQDFIDQHPLAEEKFRLDFSVEVEEVGFAEGFFTFVDRRRSGSFYGERGVDIIKALVAETDFCDAEGAIAFVETIGRYLTEDSRFQDGERTKAVDQLKSDSNVASLYDFVWMFDYLDVSYSLKQGDRDLAQLSPGEKGALLLVFFLLVSKDDIPLIIDQPEENLDNQTVYAFLVPAIKEAKKRRQVIMVTHNPNLAVCCDAEQIIHSSLDTTDGNKASYLSGSIENPFVKKLVVDVLEGTRPAFQNRRSKYGD